MYPNTEKNPYLKSFDDPADPVDHKNALELEKFLRRFGLSDVHIAYILDAVKPFKLTPHITA
jgi:hypothetical protein